MKILLRLAFRNLWRQPARTFLTMSAMAAATGILIVALGLLHGMIWDLVAGATETYHGHAKVTAAGYLDRRKVQITLREDERPPHLSDPEVLGSAARVRGFALLSFGRDAGSRTQPAELLGIDPEAERGVSRLPDKIAEGRLLSGVEGREIVLGRGLARRLGASLGGEIAAMGQAADGSIAAELFRVVGILESGDKLRDTSLALVRRRDLQEMLVLEGKVHEWVLALREPLEARAWAAGHLAHHELEGQDPSGIAVSPWTRFLPQMGEVLDMMGAYRTIYAVIFYFAVVLVTMNTMYMALLERVREFAVMGAVGLSPWRLAALIMLEALLLSVGAAAIGGLLGIAGSLYLQSHPLDFRESLSAMSFLEGTFEPVFRCDLEWSDVRFSVGLTALVGVIVALFPAFKLFRMRPVDILREV